MIPNLNAYASGAFALDKRLPLDIYNQGKLTKDIDIVILRGDKILTSNWIAGVMQPKYEKLGVEFRPDSKGALTILVPAGSDLKTLMHIEADMINATQNFTSNLPSALQPTRKMF